MKSVEYQKIKGDIYLVIAEKVCKVWGQDTCRCRSDCGNCVWLNRFIEASLAYLGRKVSPDGVNVIMMLN